MLPFARPRLVPFAISIFALITTLHSTIAAQGAPDLRPPTSVPVLIMQAPMNFYYNALRYNGKNAVVDDGWRAEPREDRPTERWISREVTQ